MTRKPPESQSPPSILQNNNGFYEATVPKQPNNSDRSLSNLGRQRQRLGSDFAASVRSAHALGVLCVAAAASTAPRVQRLYQKENWNQMYDNVNWPTPDDKRVTPGEAAQTAA